MLVRGVESSSPIERVPEVEREAGAVEHEKRSDAARRLSRSHAHKEKTDKWCGHEEGEEAPEESGQEAEEASAPAPETQPGKGLDYKA